MADLLLELGSEELPARFVVPGVEELERRVVEGLAAAGLTHGAVRRFGTPRRLAVAVDGVIEKTPDQVKEVTGPSVKAAFGPDGAPRPAAEKFAQSVGLTVAGLARKDTAKGEYLVARVEEKGKPAMELLPKVLTQAITGLTFPKAMRWGDVAREYGRPLHWIVALFGDEVVPVVFADVRSGRVTAGHRFLAPAPITLDGPAGYAARLGEAHVIADIAARRALLEERLSAAAARAGARLLADPALVDQVVNLVEEPHPVVGSFEARHLDLPPEVLIQEMKGHQRYFSLTDEAGALVPRFIAVSNTPVRDEALSVKGYERVLRARLTDGRFFFDEDRRSPLETRLPRLERRTWIQPLGSVADKARRLTALSVTLARAVGREQLTPTLERAGALCKADLETGMVGEFPELQGVMGREYARHGGETEAVALAIFEHYLPRNAQEGIPTQDPGALLGIADRLDSITGLFAIGKRPTGARDEQGLRRACLAVINITLGRGYRYSLSSLVQAALAQHRPRLAELKKQEPDVEGQVVEFFRGRLEALWREDHRPDVVDAVLAVGFDDLVGARRRLEALDGWVARPGFAALAGTFKRVANIVVKQARDVTEGPVDDALLSDPAEKALAEAVASVRARVVERAGADDHAGAMELVGPLKAPVDRFFDEVMVMAEDRAVRENRVRLLMTIASLFGTVADFSRLQSE